MIKIAGILIVVVALVIAALACDALILQGLWNYVIAAVLDLPYLSFKQLALGIAIILWLFGGSSTASVRKGRY